MKLCDDCDFALNKKEYMLILENVSVNYGAIKALTDISLQVEKARS